MITEQKKLEEIMYLSLIARFSYKQVKDGKTFIAFNAEYNNENKLDNQFANLKPIYLTSDEDTSERILKLRLNAFEDKVLNDKVIEALNEYVKDELNFSRRIVIYVHNEFNKLSEKDKKTAIENYMMNMLALYNFSVIDKKSLKACTKYMKQQIGAKEFAL